jgi:uncharacterized membrane protein YozB (DUF420 family)
MFAFLQGSGFLGTRGTLGSDLSLIIMLAAAATLTVGWRLAVARRFGAHRWVQTSAVCLNLVPVAVWMIRFFILYVIPVLPGDLGKGTYLLTTIHAVAGAIGAALGVFIMVRANQLWAKGQSLSRYRTLMRTAYLVYLLATALGVAVYWVVYVRG